MTPPSSGVRRTLFVPFLVGLAVLFLLAVSLRAGAAPYAALVMDARTGEVLHAENADTRLHPASLTKMMTLYIAFEAVENGEITLDTPILVSQKAANEVPSKLGLKAGQKIELRYLIRAAAVKSANDASTAIAEGISGSEAAFARRMNSTAKALGMTRTTFRNAHGLTADGHLSTARDMTILGRHLFYDYPQYYNLFSRVSTNAKLATVWHTNRKFLSAYEGADGIKTGYTRAAGFNLTASAERGSERIIATVFGGASTAGRNEQMAKLLDLGFRRAPTHVAVQKPRKPRYDGGVQVAAKTVRAIRAVPESVRPAPRPLISAETVIAGMESDVAAAVEMAAAAVASAPRPPAAPRADYSAATRSTAQPAHEPVVVSRVSTSGGRHWGINVGRYSSRFAAEKILLRTALAEMTTLDGALRKVAQRSGGFDANFVGMSQDQASLACRRLVARGMECTTLGPS